MMPDDLFDSPEADPLEAENVRDGLGYGANDHTEYADRADVMPFGMHYPHSVGLGVLAVSTGDLRAAAVCLALFAVWAVMLLVDQRAGTHRCRHCGRGFLFRRSLGEHTANRWRTRGVCR